MDGNGHQEQLQGRLSQGKNMHPSKLKVKFSLCSLLTHKITSVPSPHPTNILQQGLNFEAQVLYTIIFKTYPTCVCTVYVHRGKLKSHQYFYMMLGAYKYCCITKNLVGELNLAIWQAGFMTAKFKCANIPAKVLWDTTAKLNSRQHFWLYSVQ